MKRVPLRIPIYYCERYYYRGIMFQLPQNDISKVVGTGKHAYAYVMLSNHVTNNNYMAQKPSYFYIFFSCKGLITFLLKKIDFNEICTMFLG